MPEKRYAALPMVSKRKLVTVSNLGLPPAAAAAAAAGVYNITPPQESVFCSSRSSGLHAVKRDEARRGPRSGLVWSVHIPQSRRGI